MTDEHVLEIILALGESEENIRAVLMEGSRATPNASADKWSDFDIVYVTRENAPYLDGNWVKREFIPRFGEIAVRQIPDNGDPNKVYTWLIQFADGVRVDLTFNPLDFLSRTPFESATAVLLDKDGSFAALPEPSERDYLPKRPAELEYSHCCNEFWWVSPYVSKALARGQTLLALKILNTYVRPEYAKALAWLAAAATDFAVNLGKADCCVGRYVPPELYAALLSSFPRAEASEIRAALYSLLDAFPQLAQKTAAVLGFNYDADEGERAAAFIKSHYMEVPQ
ncbi:MAG: aminoglycoside 6-adenylyltransferase [Oscillospiraceae bacterium]|jgi:aminoglycoside 6-adenylyltransferase|nr:aminoglycoside 6-adenylyltransferase [Oscillospiraceae bacterium]